MDATLENTIEMVKTLDDSVKKKLLKFLNSNSQSKQKDKFYQELLDEDEKVKNGEYESMNFDSGLEFLRNL